MSTTTLPFSRPAGFQPTLPQVLCLDAGSGLAMGALMCALPGPLAAWFGLPQALLFWAGLGLFPAAGLMLLAAAWRAARRPLAWAIVLGNLAWALASLALPLVLPAVTGLGAVVVVGQALVVLALAWFEWRGLASAQPAQASRQ
jgi:hypothetical protein